MGIHVQRKRFDTLRMAELAKDGFHDPTFHIPNVNVTAQVVKDSDGYWVVVNQEGEWVTGDEPLLPDYERVA